VRNGMSEPALRNRRHCARLLLLLPNRALQKFSTQLIHSMHSRLVL
jgi:hypothetical protein